jgi:uncharacterized protein (TIGR04551 family)
VSAWRAAAFLLLAAAPGVAPRAAHATGFTDTGQDIRARTDTGFTVDGYFRARGEALVNLDLDRGLDPSGQPLFPVPLADPAAQTLRHGDLRLRTDLALYAPGGGVAVKLRFDVLDDAQLGGDAVGPPSASTTQAPTTLRVKRAWGEALTPIGLFVVGRTGAHWGLGIVANSGDCLDCDGGDATDRVALISPLGGHIVALAFDWSATGPGQVRKDGVRSLDLDPSDDVRTATVALLRWKSDEVRARRLDADKSTVEYGLSLSYRWQDNDIPSAYLPLDGPAPTIGPGSIMARGFTASAADAWFRFTMPSFRLEAEAAVVVVDVDEPSLIPGVYLPRSAQGTQLGGALETEVGGPDATISAGLDLGFASGDPAPGFGAQQKVGAPPPRPGDLDGAQGGYGDDYRLDNFRFNSDYRVDRILFREIIGTVTDAVYVRPHVRWRVGRIGRGDVEAHVAVIASTAVEAASTPGGEAPLGVEIDPTIVYESDDGFHIALEHAVLFPLAGLDNKADGLDAQPAQLWRVRVAYLF